MNENETQTATTETPAPAAKSRKPRKAAKNDKKAKPAVGLTNGKLGFSPQRVKVLKAAKVAGTLGHLTKRAGLPDRAVYHHLWHLRKDGFIKSHTVDADGKNELIFELKAKGKQAVSKVK